ncbi:MAG: protein TolR [Proteobacteria bacterium]|nr:protein TolR [Pseudomonadota bacterium]HQR04829.1 protein TolR [Rhodocyclaceae bacterium]
MRQRRLMNSINVVPYIDVMLVLLVIFMVTAPMIQTGSVDLPSVGKTSQPPVAPLEVIVHDDGSLALKNRAKGDTEIQVGSDQLAGAIRAAHREHPDQAVLIAGDKKVRYEAVLNVMSELQRQEIGRIGLLVQPAGK